MNRRSGVVILCEQSLRYIWFWFCRGSVDVMMGHEYGALVAIRNTSHSHLPPVFSMQRTNNADCPHKDFNVDML